MTLVYFVGGLVILVIGAEGLVRGSSALALRLGISPLVIGLTVVAFGTSSPELAVSIESALSGSSSIALGNVIGSNIANIGLILGLTALIQPMLVQKSLLREQIPLMIGISALIWFLASDQTLDLWNGLLLLLGLIGYIYFSYRSSQGEEAADSVEILPGDVATLKDKTWFCIILILTGLGGLVGGGMLFVNSAVELARIFSVDEAIIGLTIVAIGTSMPELATSVVAAVRKESDIAIGNIVGSNIFNILGILGIAAIIKPLSSVGFSAVDYGVMLAFAVALLLLALTGRRLSRPEGAALLAGYVGYMYYIWPES
ncbi:MAG: calcium/sodium antiporter [Gammaproteobacteria bacterium]|nr:calcium/sodium antiporter [Gammaproteobacteria bacterium]MDP2141851.1 calcium/sodium antiporter [Gammaproteobacteria bacterium]MDP2348342.1 calcium/sodium antiporter [Gammaproteobacteria bacterium]